MYIELLDLFLSLCTLALFPAFPPSSMQKRKGEGMVYFIMCCPTVQYVKMEGEGLVHLSWGGGEGGGSL